MLQNLEPRKAAMKTWSLAGRVQTDLTGKAEEVIGKGNMRYICGLWDVAPILLTMTGNPSFCSQKLRHLVLSIK